MQMNIAHHFELLTRFDRGLALKEIIFAAVKPGNVVVDCGCGTGLLSLWAAQAGASRVIAVDSADISPGVRLAEENGVADRLQFIQSDLREFNLPDGQRCDVLIGMIYHNDPRRDYAQTQLNFELRDRLLKPAGIHIPGRIEYTVQPFDWPQQELGTRFSDMDRRMAMVESRYGLKLQSFLDHAKDTADRTWFPHRLASGLLQRPDARVLGSEPSRFATIDLSAVWEDYPDLVECRFDTHGLCNTLLFTQSLYYEDKLIFTNESLTWVVNPQPVHPGQRAIFHLDESWLNNSFSTMDTPQDA